MEEISSPVKFRCVWRQALGDRLPCGNGRLIRFYYHRRRLARFYLVKDTFEEKFLSVLDLDLDVELELKKQTTSFWLQSTCFGITFC